MKKRKNTTNVTATGAGVEMGSRQAAVYVMTHTAFTPPPDSMYRPLQVGRSPWNKKHSGDISPLRFYLGDDTGDEISNKNCYYSELTGMYWVWKNAGEPYVGTCHYRRYLLNKRGQLFTEKEIIEILTDYDVITTKNLQLNFSYYEGFASHHKISYLDETAHVIRERHPEYADTFEKLVHEKHTYFGNMLIAKKDVYDAYMSWLFDILFEVEHRVTIDETDSYHRRIFGFISEFLQYVWICHNKLRVYECMVGMTGEKTEIAEVRCRLAEYFENEDVDGAKDYFLTVKKARPDLLMEASDLTGELHLCMEVIAIAGLEQQAYGTNLLQRIHGFRELMDYCNHLNSYVIQEKAGDLDEKQMKWIQAAEVTEVAKSVARQLFQGE